MRSSAYNFLKILKIETWVLAYAQTHWNVHIQYMQILCSLIIPHKTFKTFKKEAQIEETKFMTENTLLRRSHLASQMGSQRWVSLNGVALREGQWQANMQGLDGGIYFQNLISFK